MNYGQTRKRTKGEKLQFSFQFKGEPTAKPSAGKEAENVTKGGLLNVF